MPRPSKDSLIAQGRTAEVYAWQDGQVLKLFFDWCPAAWIQREAQVGRKISATTLPTPHVIDTVEIQGRRGIIYERVNGASLLTVMSSKPWLLTRLARSFAELHVQVHKQSGESLTQVRVALRKNLTENDTLPTPLKTRVVQVLDQLTDGTTLCHFDFHPDQVLITDAGLVIIDWMTAYQGDPIADVARTTVLFRVGQLPKASWLQRKLIDLGREQFYDAYLRRYLELDPRTTQDRINTWMIPVAAARLKEDIAGEREPLLDLIQTLLQKQQAA